MTIIKSLKLENFLHAYSEFQDILCSPGYKLQQIQCICFIKEQFTAERSHADSDLTMHQWFTRSPFNK